MDRYTIVFDEVRNMSELYYRGTYVSCRFGGHYSISDFDQNVNTKKNESILDALLDGYLLEHIMNNMAMHCFKNVLTWQGAIIRNNSGYYAGGYLCIESNGDKLMIKRAKRVREIVFNDKSNAHVHSMGITSEECDVCKMKVKALFHNNAKSARH